MLPNYYVFPLFYTRYVCFANSDCSRVYKLWNKAHCHFVYLSILLILSCQYFPAWRWIRTYPKARILYLIIKWIQANQDDFIPRGRLSSQTMLPKRSSNYPNIICRNAGLSALMRAIIDTLILYRNSNQIQYVSSFNIYHKHWPSLSHALLFEENITCRNNSRRLCGCKFPVGLLFACI